MFVKIVSICNPISEDVGNENLSYSSGFDNAMCKLFEMIIDI